MTGSADDASGPLEVFRVALRLGLTSFGGPVAHLGYFRSEYVDRRGWLTDHQFAEIVALAQFLPGPASSQVGMAVGHSRAGFPGAVAGWLGFTMPSVVAMAAFGAVASSRDVDGAVWVHALKLVAVAVVLDAVLGMARTLARTALTATLAVLTAATLLVLPATGLVQLACLVGAAILGCLLARPPDGNPATDLPVRVGRPAGALCLTLYAGVYGALLAVVALAGAPVLARLATAVYRCGALVFGGGHVVLPLLQSQLVPGLVSRSDFLAGYGAAQAVPGPLFTFAGYLGEVAAGPTGAVVATIGIFLPGFLVLFGVLPFWQRIRGQARVRGGLVGVNAAVVGLLAAAFVEPIVTGSIGSVVDALFAAGLFALLRLTRLAAWMIVLVAVVASPVLLLS